MVSGMSEGQEQENQLLKYLSMRFGVRCEECGKKRNLTVHHRVPRRDAGKNNSMNLEILCVSCHRKREGIDKPKKAWR
jgi:5-methylcytosine-specific restriction endonuclease McrA